MASSTGSFTGSSVGPTFSAGISAKKSARTLPQMEVLGRARPTKYIGIGLSPYSASKTSLIASSATDKYITNISTLIGVVRVGSFAICFFISFRALSAFSVQAKSVFSIHRFKVLKNGSEFSAAFDRILFNLASFLFRLCTSFSVLGEDMLIMAWAFSPQA
nr:hypothetical protein [Tanacetum cinerariifolium]